MFVSLINTFPLITLNEAKDVMGVSVGISDDIRRITCDAPLIITKVSPRGSFINVNAEGSSSSEGSLIPLSSL